MPLIPLAIVGVIFFRSASPATTLGTAVRRVAGVAVNQVPMVLTSAVKSFRKNYIDDIPKIQMTNETGHEFTVPVSWCTGMCVNSEVYYMNTDKRFVIRGGPTPDNHLRPFEVVCVT